MILNNKLTLSEMWEYVVEEMWSLYGFVHRVYYPKQCLMGHSSSFFFFKEMANSKEYSGKEKFFSKPKEFSKLFLNHGGSLKFDCISTVLLSFDNHI